jgi:hypothetical protein
MQDDYQLLALLVQKSGTQFTCFTGSSPLSDSISWRLCDCQLAFVSWRLYATNSKDVQSMHIPFREEIIHA